ncbi:hypothetical protein ACQYRI_10520 [Salmonella enterica]
MSIISRPASAARQQQIELQLKAEIKKTLQGRSVFCDRVQKVTNRNGSKFVLGSFSGSSLLKPALEQRLEKGISTRCVPISGGVKSIDFYTACLKDQPS